MRMVREPVDRRSKPLVVTVAMAVLIAIVVQLSLYESSPPVKHLIDTHIHLYDTTRDQQVTWPPEDDDVLYKPHLPDEFTATATSAGVTGVVIVEASLELDDNRWVLDLVKDDELYIGLVGNIDVNRTDFAERLKELSADARFVGVRARCADPVDFTDDQVLSNLRNLAEAGMTLDYLTNGGGIPGIETIEKVATAIPDLRIVVNHCLGYDFDGEPPPLEWIEAVKKLARHENVYCKISGLFQRSVPQPAPQNVDFYASVLDVIWDAFGTERLIYGSNWPVTKHTGSYRSFLKVVHRYISSKGQNALEDYYWRNAASVYGLTLE